MRSYQHFHTVVICLCLAGQGGALRADIVAQCKSHMLTPDGVLQPAQVPRSTTLERAWASSKAHLGNAIDCDKQVSSGRHVFSLSFFVFLFVCPFFFLVHVVFLFLFLSPSLSLSRSLFPFSSQFSCCSLSLSLSLSLFLVSASLFIFLIFSF